MCSRISSLVISLCCVFLIVSTGWTDNSISKGDNHVLNLSRQSAPSSSRGWNGAPHAECSVSDYYWESTNASGEAEIVKMYTSEPEETEIVTCEFDYGDEIAFVIICNDWPGGNLGLEGFVFWCHQPLNLICVTDIPDIGYVRAGDVKVVVIGLGIIPPVDCRVDWAVKVLLDQSEWDIGGYGKLKPGPDTGPNDECGCITVSR
jgi:hypothetical protein